jgi:hypothetical protein
MKSLAKTVLQGSAPVIIAFVGAIMTFVIVAMLVVVVSGKAGSDTNAGYNDAALGMLMMAFAAPSAVAAFVLILRITLSKRSRPGL